MNLIQKIKRYFTKHNGTPKSNRKKVGIFLFSMTFVMFFLFAGRLSYIVLAGKVSDVSLKDKTDALYKGSQTVAAKRGTIYDRNGIAIAEDATSYSAYIILSKTYTTGDKKLYAEPKNFEALAKILKTQVEAVDVDDVVKQLENGEKAESYQVEINSAKNLTLKQKQAIEEAMEKQDIVGIYFTESPARLYPNGAFASHLIGYTDVVEEKTGEKELVGKMGIEAAYNDILKGKDGKIVYQKDNYQNPLPGTISESTPAEDGKDIYTTLDSRIQVYLDQYMKEYFDKLDAENMTAMLVKADTGEIIALSQQPTFDPETKEGTNADTFKWGNILVQDTYEPGSTMKILTTAAGMTEGVYNPNETYQGGKIEVADATIDDWDHGEKGLLTMRQALSWSSNKGMVILEEKMPDVWQEYLKKFGFGRSTYSGLNGEVSGELPADNIVDRAMSAFGQGIAVTNFQMMQAFTAIANDGVMVKPQFITKLVDPNTNKETVMSKEIVGNPVTAESAELTRQYMRDTTENKDYGIAYGKYVVPGYNVSVKTGTAQIAEDGKYLFGGTDYIYSAVSMVPSENPEYIFYLTIKKPKDYDYNALSDITNAILKRAMDLSSSNDGPTKAASSEIEKVTVEDYRNFDTDQAAASAQKMGLEPIVVGTGSKVAKQSIPTGSKVLAGERLILLTDSETRVLPDLTGWSKADVVSLASLLDLDVEFNGDGFVTNQSIEAYQEVQKNDKITITLASNE
ncbi:penicillin-binding transpeptidase domain-containing protein [Enterococcus bulliens]